MTADLAAWRAGRYYQAWLEGGGGAYPAAVEEEHSDDLPEEDIHGEVWKKLVMENDNTVILHGP